MEPMTEARLMELLHEHDEGLLRHGSHRAGGREFCALEFDSIVRGRAWSDAPITLPDLRRLNDARWSSDEARTAGLVRVMAALWDWSTWTRAQRSAWVSEVAIQTVRQIIANLPPLSEAVKTKCQQSADLQTARQSALDARVELRARAAAHADAADAAAAHAASAADAAADAASAADAAASAADAASAAAAAAAKSRADDVLNTACDIFVTSVDKAKAIK